jgi:hypothetical protein
MNVAHHNRTQVQHQAYSTRYAIAMLQQQFRNAAAHRAETKQCYANRSHGPSSYAGRFSNQDQHDIMQSDSERVR